LAEPRLENDGVKPDVELPDDELPDPKTAKAPVSELVVEPVEVVVVVVVGPGTVTALEVVAALVASWVSHDLPHRYTSTR